MSDVFAIVLDVSGTRSVSGDRRTLRGFARVKVLAVTDQGVSVEVLDGSGVARGRTLSVRPHDVYASPEEVEYFPKIVGFLLEGLECPERPAVSMKEAPCDG